MKKITRNVTISLEENVARWIRVEAARADLSVSRWLGDLLLEHMQNDVSYQTARERFFAIRPRDLRSREMPLPSREDLYDRPGLR